MAALRKLLAVPKTKRPSDWQSCVSPMISAIWVDLSKQTNPEIALAELTLIALASQKGSKDAKKRALKPTRWLSNAPPSISELFDEIDEARSAVRVLQPLRADWLSGYVYRELKKNKWPTLVASLLEWLLKVTPSVEDFLRTLNELARESISENESCILSVLENTTKLLAKSPLPAGVGMLSEVAELASQIDTHAPGSSASSNSSTKQKIRSALLALISQVSSVEPAVLLQGAVIAAITRLHPASGPKKSASPRELEILCRRTISLLAVLWPRADHHERSHYREIWCLYRKIVPKAEQMLKYSAQEAPALSFLETPAAEQSASQELSVNAALENVLCEFIVNWDDYYKLHLGDPAVQQLSSRIDELILQLGVARFGEVGQVLAFDPVRHYSATNSSVPPSKVIIIKPGILLRRTDSTSRVLLMAAVSPLSTQ